MPLQVLTGRSVRSSHWAVGIQTMPGMCVASEQVTGFTLLLGRHKSLHQVCISLIPETTVLDQTQNFINILAENWHLGCIHLSNEQGVWCRALTGAQGTAPSAPTGLGYSVSAAARGSSKELPFGQHLSLLRDLIQQGIFFNRSLFSVLLCHQLSFSMGVTRTEADGSVRAMCSEATSE